MKNHRSSLRRAIVRSLCAVCLTLILQSPSFGETSKSGDSFASSLTISSLGLTFQTSLMRVFDFDIDYRDSYRDFADSLASDVQSLHKQATADVLKGSPDKNARGDRFGGGAIVSPDGEVTSWFSPYGKPALTEARYGDSTASWYFDRDGRLVAFVNPDSFTAIFRDGVVRLLIRGDLRREAQWFIADETGNLREFGKVTPGVSWIQATVGDDGKIVSRMEYGTKTMYGEALIRTTSKGADLVEEACRLGESNGYRYLYSVIKPDGSRIAYMCPADPVKQYARYSEYDPRGKTIKDDTKRVWASFGIPIPTFKKDARVAVFLPGFATARDVATKATVTLPATFAAGPDAPVTLKVDRDGYATAELVLKPDANWAKPPFETLFPDMGAYSAAAGTIAVSSEPTTGAAVMINGAMIGLSPLEYRYRGDKRTFDVAIVKNGTTLEKTIVAEKAGPYRAEFAVDFEPRVWVLDGDDEGAAVFLDGTEVDAVPCTISAVGPGHKVEIRKEGYATIVLDRDPGPGKTEELRVSMKIDWEQRRDDKSTMGFNLGGGVWLMPETDVSGARTFWFGDLSISIATPYWLYFSFGAGGGFSAAPETPDSSPIVPGDAKFVDAHAAIGPQLWLGDAAILYATAGLYSGMQFQSYELRPGWTVEKDPAEYLFYAGPQLAAGFRVQGKRVGLFSEATFRKGSKAEGGAIKTGITAGIFLGAD